jgi:hypothetical protein
VVKVSYIGAGYLTRFSGSSSSTSTSNSAHSHKNTTAANGNIQPNNPGSTNPGAANQPMMSGNQTAAAAANSTANGVLIGSPNSNTTLAGNDTSGGHQTLFGSHITGMTNRLGNMTSSLEASFNKYLLQAKGNSSDTGSSNSSSLAAADNSSMAASAAPAAPVTSGPATSPPMLQF